jgi:hypothetical protein
MAGINKLKLVLNHRGVKVYHSWKNKHPLTFWYALTPGHDAEEDGQDFDVRALPEKYTQGLLVEDDWNPPDTVGVIKKYADLLDAHKMARVERPPTVKGAVVAAREIGDPGAVT